MEFWLNYVWLKPVSIIVLFLTEALASIAFFPKTSEETYIPFFIYCVIGVIALLTYSAFVYIENYRYPKAEKDETGVLFVFHTQDDNVYKDAKFNITEKFNKFSANYSEKLKAVCINVEKIKGFNMGNKQFMVNLLTKTRCVFCVDVTYQVDDVNNTNEYEVCINTGTLHPNFDEKRSNILIGELSRISTPIKKIKFNKQHKLDKLNITSEYLSFAIEYIVGVVFLLDSKFVFSQKIFENLYARSLKDGKWLKEEIKRNYYISCHSICGEIIEKYYDDFSKDLLEPAEKYTLLMNDLYPDTFGYNLEMAMIKFSKYRDISGAKKHVKRCKEIGVNDRWHYSDAFLTAYSSENLSIIYSKYQKAITCDYNPIRIISFIDNVLQEEPDKLMLHFVLGFLYYKVDNHCLAIHHMNTFVGLYDYKKNGSKKSVEFIDNVLNNTDCEGCISVGECEKELKAS